MKIFNIFRKSFIKFTNLLLEINQKNSSKSIRIFFINIFEEIFFIILKTSSIITETKNPVCIITGKEKNSNKKIIVLFISNKKSVKYLSSLIFSDIQIKEKMQKTSIFNIEKKIKKYSKNIDLVFVKSDSVYANFLQKKEFTVVPQYVSMKLDLTGSLDDIYYRFNKAIRYNIRKIQKNGFSYEMTNDLDKLDFFYNKMYLPYARLRYQDNALCSGYLNIRSVFNRGCLMLVKDQGKYILGNIIMENKESCMMAYMGVMEGSEDCLNKGASIASIYYSILLAKEKGYKELHFGYVRGFLNNGVLQHNRQWGAGIYKTNFPLIGNEYVGIYGFKVLNWNEATRSFVSNNPVVCIEKNRFKAKVFVNEQVKDVNMNHLRKTFCLPGIKKLIVFPLNNKKLRKKGG